MRRIFSAGCTFFLKKWRPFCRRPQSTRQKLLNKPLQPSKNCENWASSCNY